jgi:DNA-binding HxlR family transcriptional regulator
VPQLSDRLLSERMKELEARGLVRRTVDPGPPVRVRYGLTKMGTELAPALGAVKAWARRWLSEEPNSGWAEAPRSAARPARMN